ncbi:Coiled-coil domain-containing protein [Actinidia chinensis var. chinensis]|uniref:Uncharacterized protein n=2 Tax=Actinidia TaxID=3624 RepID=A0A7J0ETI8_9ERIC|nr:Coiled-coil domain-containing protein [Actinidia chinensis var. chinensis]GFY89650.1 hypothetical protein Acr_06g0015900 [Actinidia rufa]
MSAMVGVWVGEIVKIGEKVRARKPFLLKRRKEVDQEDQGNETAAKLSEKQENTMSEATICLLMDRFAPC